MKEFAFRDVRMVAYYAKGQKLEDKFDGIEPHHILWWDNEEAHTLARVASSCKPLPPRVFLNVLDAPSIHLEEGKAPAPIDTTSALTYITEGALPP